MADYDVITIGAGHTGLIASALLAREGKKVLCLELNDRVGGLAGNANDLGAEYTHNRGAYFLMFANLNWLWDALELDKFGMELLAPDTANLILGGVGRKPLKLYADPKEMLDYLAREFGPDIAQQYTDFYAFLTPFAKAMNYAICNPPIPLSQMMMMMPGVQAQDAMRKLFFGNVQDLVDEFFPDHERAAAIRGYIMGLAGDGFFGGPMTPGSAMTVAYHAVTPEEGTGGAPYRVPKGNMGMFSETIAKAFKHYGGEVRLNTEVVKILIKNGAAVGVQLADGTQISANTIISSLDTYNTFINLVGADNCEPFFVKQVKGIEYREHLPQMYFVFNKLPEYGGMYTELNESTWRFQNWIFNPDLMETNWDLVKHGQVPHETTGVGLVLQSILDDTLAPPGKYVGSACGVWAWPLNVKPEELEQKEAELAEAWISGYEKYMPNFRDCIDKYKVMSPQKFQAKFHNTGGTWTHGMVKIDQMFNYRPIVGMSDYRAPFANMYLCGTSNHPGPGVTGRSAFNCVNIIKQDWETNKKK